MIEFSQFQIQTEFSIVSILRERKIKYSKRIEGGPDEFAKVLNFCGIDIWLYPDGGEIIGGKIDDRFEIYDYDSLNELSLDLIKKVTFYIDRHL